MSRPKNPVPKYLLHKSSGQARVVIDGRDVYLGAHGSPASFAAYAKLVAELKVSHGPQVHQPGKVRASPRPPSPPR